MVALRNYGEKKGVAPSRELLYLEIISFSCRDHRSLRLNLALKAFVWKHFLLKSSDVVKSIKY